MIHTDSEQSFVDPLSAGRAALARGAWEEARACFAAALEERETPEALEGLGLAVWWLEEGAATFDARERAYRLYRASDDRRGAARLAVALAEDYLTFRGEPAVAHGWLRRAHRLLEGLERCAEHGWLVCLEGYIAFLVAEGLSNQKIAAKLSVSEHTVKRHVANILTKLDLPSQAAAAAHAARRGLL